MSSRNNSRRSTATWWWAMTAVTEHTHTHTPMNKGLHILSHQSLEICDLLINEQEGLLYCCYNTV